MEPRAMRGIYTRLLLLVVALGISTAPAHAQGIGILQAGPAFPQRLVRTALTNPVVGMTWCADGNDLTFKVWNGTNYQGGTVAGVSAINLLSGSLTLAGTANQVNVVSGGTTITLSTPQSIATTSSVAFANVAV